MSVSFDPGIDMGIEGDKEPIGLILIKDFDPLGIVFVIEEIDIFFDQFHGGLINSSVERDSSVTVDFSSCSGAEEVREISGSGSQEVKVVGVTIPRCFFRCAMDVAMVGLVTPLFEPFVQGAQREGRRKKGKKLHSYGFEKAFNLPFPLGAIRGTVNERDSEGGGGVGELVRAEGRAIVEIDLSGKSPFAQSLDQAIGQVFEVFLEIELPMGNKTGVVIQEGKEKTLAHFSIDDHRRPVHTVGLPDVIGQFRFIPSEVRFETLRFVQPQPLKEPIEALNGGVKVGRKKLSFPGHPENHGQGSSFEFCL